MIDELKKARLLLYGLEKELSGKPKIKISEAIESIDAEINLLNHGQLADDKRILSRKKTKTYSSFLGRMVNSGSTEYNSFYRLLKSAIGKIVWEMFNVKIIRSPYGYLNKLIRIYTPVFWYLEASKELFNATKAYINADKNDRYQHEMWVNLISIEVLQNHFNFIQNNGLKILDKH